MTTQEVATRSNIGPVSPSTTRHYDPQVATVTAYNLLLDCLRSYVALNAWLSSHTAPEHQQVLCCVSSKHEV